MNREPARYFPIEKGVYEVGPGLRTLGHPFGNGKADSLAFQIDREFGKYRENRLRCRSEKLEKYYLTSEYAPEVSSAVNRFMVEQLCAEHPENFRWVSRGSDGGTLECALTGEAIELDSRYELASPCQEPVGKPYVSAFDALCSQVQEDVAVVSTADGGRDWLSSIHLCSPGHWAAADKIGKNFVDIHTPVAGIEKVNRAAASLVDAMINKGPYVRFVWGFGTDDRLNHHPDPAPGWDAAEWKGRSFSRDREGSPFILRLERQVLLGLPAVRSAIFLIRPYFIDGDEIRRNPTERALLRSALLSIPPDSRVYKGLDRCMDEVIAWIDEA